MNPLDFDHTYNYEGKDYFITIRPLGISIHWLENETGLYKRYYVRNLNINQPTGKVIITLDVWLEKPSGEIVEGSKHEKYYTLSVSEYNYFLHAIGLPIMGPSFINGIQHYVLNHPVYFETGQPLEENPVIPEPLN